MKTIVLTSLLFTASLFAETNSTNIDNYIDTVANSTKKILHTTQSELNDLHDASIKEIHKLTKQTKKLADNTIKSYSSDEKNSSLLPSQESLKSIYQSSKEKVSDLYLHATIKHAFYINKNIHSNIYLNITNGNVELFGKIKDKQEEIAALKVASTIKGVRSVSSFLFIEKAK